jgi:hypothetical protein
VTDYRRPQRHAVIKLENDYILKFIPVWRDEKDSHHRYVTVFGQEFECTLRVEGSSNYGEPDYPRFAGAKVYDYALDIRSQWFNDYFRQYGEYPRGISVYQWEWEERSRNFEECVLWTRIWSMVDGKIVKAITRFFIDDRIEEEFYGGKLDD